MKSRHTNFVIQICFDYTIPPFYVETIVNKLSGEKLKASYDHNKSSSLPKFCIVSDIPDYLDVERLERETKTAILKIPQYKGYLINLKRFNSVDELIGQNLGKNSRKNLRAKHRKLELNHEISYQFYYGKIDRNQYDHLFDVCYRLMETRFHQKKIYNRYLLDWKYYHDLFYPKILSKEASICVIYDGPKPITITLNFHRGDIVFSFIQIYDTDYFKYSLGDIAMYKNIEWSYANNFAVWDVSKGATENKLRWSNHNYLFDYHIFYSVHSPIHRFLAFITSQKLKLKQLLRNKGIIGGTFQLDRLYYYTKRKKLKGYAWRNE
ncbi:GNAT family N-acetyltransferase [Ulvibacterium marinum]|uniref:GNAT family N-acetyltransferase n=1 Tax=Ulvibacterium marinum TaxID=2419782 RepID=A0A3B0BWN9_9FLAO|nr:GNAT family N-acetyltransferase [Ulvibacterium marinum]RKN76931.1 GNAT family N-acetyltransferase [Ulvibacterium marinum]